MSGDPLEPRAPAGFRTLPENIEAEAALLGAILINNEAYHRVSDFLRPEHFYEPVHGRIFEAMRRLIEQGRLADHLTLKVAFDQDEALRELDGAQYLARLARAAETVMNARDYGLAIADLAVRRGLIRAAQDAANLAYDGAASADIGPDEQITRLRQHLASLDRALPPVNGDALAVLDLASLTGRTPPPRRYAWHPWIPARMATLLHSFGGVGKSLLAQQIATVYALGLELFGGATEGRPALVLAGEDDQDELWRRQLDICRRLGVRLEDAIGKLDLLAVPHLDVTLAEANESGVLTTTPMLAALRQRIKVAGYGLVMLDNSAKLFAVREGDRIGVTRCVGLLNAICQDFNASAVLVAHDNRSGEYSGSTAWENCCRSRLHLKRDDDDGAVVMTMPKANYAATGAIKLRWEDWAFRADDPACMTDGERLEAKLTARAHGEVFLRALDRLTEQARNLSDSKRADNYAPKVIFERGLADGLTKRQLEAAMVLLLNEGRIKAGEPVVKGGDRHWKYGLARATPRANGEAAA